MTGAVLVNCFEVPGGREDELLRLWREADAGSFTVVAEHRRDGPS